jgi:hypothetical protein
MTYNSKYKFENVIITVGSARDTQGETRKYVADSWG